MSKKQYSYLDYLMKKSTQQFPLRNLINPQVNNTSNLPYFINQEVASARKIKNLSFKQYHYNISNRVEKKIKSKQYFSNSLQKLTLDNKIKDANITRPENKFLREIFGDCLFRNQIDEPFTIESIPQSKQHFAHKNKEDDEQPIIPERKQLRYLLHSNISEKCLSDYFRQYNYLQLKDKIIYNKKHKNDKKLPIVQNNGSNSDLPLINEDQFYIKKIATANHIRANQFLDISANELYFRPSSAQKKKEIKNVTKKLDDCNKNYQNLLEKQNTHIELFNAVSNYEVWQLQKAKEKQELYQKKLDNLLNASSTISIISSQVKQQSNTSQKNAQIVQDQSKISLNKSQKEVLLEAFKYERDTQFHAKKDDDFLKTIDIGLLNKRRNAIQKQTIIKIGNEGQLQIEQEEQQTCQQNIKRKTNLIKLNLQFPQKSKKKDPFLTQIQKENCEVAKQIQLIIQEWEHRFQKLTQNSIIRDKKINVLKQIQNKAVTNEELKIKLLEFYKRCQIEVDQFLKDKQILIEEFHETIEKQLEQFLTLKTNDIPTRYMTQEFEKFVAARIFKRKLIEYLLSQLKQNMKGGLLKKYQDKQKMRKILKEYQLHQI